MESNICHYIPYHKEYHSIQTLNFVYETNISKVRPNLTSETYYKMYYVVSGKGFLHVPGQIYPIKKDDVFITFPSEPYMIENSGDLVLMYISYIGLRANMLNEKAGAKSSGFILSDCSALYDMWKTGINCNREYSDLISEGILLYTYYHICDRTSPEKNEEKDRSSTLSRIKKYIDDNFSRTDFSIAQISNDLSYNSKYISHTFKKNMGVGIIEYLNTVRIQNACTMAKQGFTSISDISYRCGFSDPQYFSKIFKSHIGMSPKNYIKSINSHKIYR